MLFDGSSFSPSRSEYPGSWGRESRTVELAPDGSSKLYNLVAVGDSLYEFRLLILTFQARTVDERGGVVNTEVPVRAAILL